MQLLRPASRLRVDNDSDNYSVEAERRSKDDHDEHADKCCAVLRSHKGRARAEYSNTDAAKGIWDAYNNANPEGCVSWAFSQLVVLLTRIDGVPVLTRALLLRDKQSNDEAIDATGLAQDDTDEVLWLDARHLHHGTQDGRGSDHDAPK